MQEYIYTLDRLEGQLRSMRKTGVQKGEWTGFDALYEKYSIKRGSTTYLYAGAHQGKSQFAFELMINLAEFRGWKWAVYTPETGSPAEVYAELAWCYLRKPFLINDKVNATDVETDRALAFLKEHFYVIDSGLRDISIEGFYTTVDEIESTGVKIDGCLVDPFTEIKTDINSGVRDDIAIGNVLTKVRKHSNDKDYHTIVTVHTKHQQAKYKNGIPYVDVPTMNDIAGGMQWSRKGMMILNVWRCPYGMEDENGVPYEPNQVKISIVKAKPKAVGNVGSLYMFYDRISNRYYVPNGLGKKLYSHQQHTSGKVVEQKNMEF